MTWYFDSVFPVRLYGLMSHIYAYFIIKLVLSFKLGGGSVRVPMLLMLV